MLIIDTLTIYVCAAIAVLALATPLLSPFFRGRKLLPLLEPTPYDNGESEETTGETNDNTTETPLPSISIVLTPHEKAIELETTLPRLLSQQYDGRFEVIVVAWKGDSDTEDVLKRFEHNEHFYHTYIPESSRYMSRKKLAMTLGAKASKCDWLLFTEIECCPDSDQWLAEMASQGGDATDIVVGYTHYDDETSAYKRFEHLFDELYLLSEVRRHKPYRTNSSNLLMRKRVFDEGEGFRGNLKYLRGEYDFLLNKYADNTNTVLQLSTKSWLTELSPSRKSWLNKHLFYMETRQHLRHSLRHRLPMMLDAVALHLTLVLFLAAGVASALCQHWIITACAAAGIIVVTTVRTAFAKKVTAHFEPTLSSGALFFYEMATVWHRLSYRLRYWRADKNDFISHKL